jgi:NADPH:quinone reductase-like Zn-dependent oxidoreductase
MRAVAVNRLKPVVDRIFEFDDAVEAFKALKGAQHFGKLVIRI